MKFQSYVCPYYALFKEEIIMKYEHYSDEIEKKNSPEPLAMALFCNQPLHKQRWVKDS